eukprot:127869-Rhodomonas_salina.1
MQQSATLFENNGRAVFSSQLISAHRWAPCNASWRGAARRELPDSAPAGAGLDCAPADDALGKAAFCAAACGGSCGLGLTARLV